MTRWSYLGVNVLTGAVVESLPLTGVSFSRVLSGTGSLQATLDLRGQSAARCAELVDAVDAGRRAVYVLADGQPVWGGPVWQDGDQDGDILTLAATEWGGYFAKRFIRSSVTYTSQDQLAIARSLVTTAQAVSGGNVLVATGTETSGVTRTVTYTAGSMPVVDEQLTQLANLSNGFDYCWPVEWNGSLLRGRLLLGYPHLGVSTSAYVVHAPRGRARQTQLQRDASNMATTSWAVGQAPSGNLAPVASTTDTTLLAGGYPVLEKVETYSDLSDGALLQAHADADQAANGGVLVSTTADVPIEDVTTGAVNLGDTVRFERQSRRDGSGFVTDLRVTQIDFQTEQQVCTLTLSPRITVGGRVPTKRDLDQRVAHLWRAVRLLAVGT